MCLDDFEVDLIECPACDRLTEREYAHQARLGRLDHYNCPGCGMWWSHPAEDEDTE